MPTRPAAVLARLARQFLDQPPFFVFGQPRRLVGPIRQIKQRDHAQHDGRNSFEDEDPTPTGEPVPVRGLEYPARKRQTEHNRERLRNHEPGLGTRPVFGPEPVRKIHDHSGKKTGFRGSQQKAQPIELRPHAEAYGQQAREARKGCHEAPGNHDARQPAPRAPLLHDQRAGDFEQKIAEEEHARAEPDHFIGKPESTLHLQFRDGDIGAIEIRGQIDENQERHQPQSYPPTGPFGHRHQRARTVSI